MIDLISINAFGCDGMHRAQLLKREWDSQGGVVSGVGQDWALVEKPYLS